jgi:glycosyltransferase involved in cell wall biosynthesis
MPRVLHLLDDKNLGGILSGINSLEQSRLSQQVDFEIAPYQEIWTILRTAPPDIILLHNPCAWKYLPNLLRLKQTGIPLIIYEHHYSEQFERLNVPDRWRFRLMLKTFYHLVDRVVAVSYGQANWLRHNHLVDEQKLITIQQSRILDAFFEVPDRAIHQPLILGAYGRFSVQKGFDTLLQAMSLLSGKEVFLKVGGYGTEEDNLKTMAQGLEKIEFCGLVRDVPAFLATCDVVVIPSRWEPWGHVCQEAKAAGKPVIVADIDGLSEQVQDCGILVQPDDPQKLAEAIQEVVNLPTQTIEDWGRVGRDSVRSAWGKYLEEWEQLLCQDLD